MVLAATPNRVSSGQRRACSTSTIEIDIMALMQWPSVLSAPTLMGYFYTLNDILTPPHTIHRNIIAVSLVRMADPLLSTEIGSVIALFYLRLPRIAMGR